MTKTTSNKAALSWALYDWANSSFATTVMAGFFPIFFKDYWSKGTEATESTFWLGVSVSTAGLLVAIVAPLLGAMADQGAAKKRALLTFTGLGIIATGAMAAVSEGSWPTASLLYVLGTVGFLCSLIFYDSLLVSVSTKDTVDMVSSRGYGLGYLGGGLLFLLNVIAVEKPSLFGLESATEAVRWSFVSVAVWWGLFSLPLLLFVPEPRGGTRMSLAQSARKGFTQVASTVREIRKIKVVFVFLLAYWFYIDGVDTVITMAVDYGKAIGFGTTDLITALLMVQFIGFPCAYLAGFLAKKWGAKTIILCCLAVYILVTVLGSQMDLEPYQLFGFEVSKFFVIAFLVALVQGGVQALSRAFYSRLIPKEKAAEFFGFYNMLGKFAAIIGPILMGTIGRLSGNPRMGIQSVALLFVVGALILWRVKGAETEQSAT